MHFILIGAFIAMSIVQITIFSALPRYLRGIFCYAGSSGQFSFQQIDTYVCRDWNKKHKIFLSVGLAKNSLSNIPLLKSEKAGFRSN